MKDFDEMKNMLCALAACILVSFASPATAQSAGIAERLDQAVGALERATRALEEKTKEVDQLRAQLDEMQDRIAATNRVSAQMTENADKLRQSDTKLSSVQRDVADLSKKLEILPEVKAMETRLSGAIDVGLSGCTSPRIVSGRSSVTNTNWVIYNNQNEGMYADIDTTAAKFSNTPIYFTSLGGRSHHWWSLGVTSVYSAKKNGFRVYVRFPDPDYQGSSRIVDSAGKHDWHVNWMAIGC